MTLDEDITLVCAFRYALGRMTYVVSSVCNEIERQVNSIPPKTRRQFIMEIDEAVENQQAGMMIDVERWHKCKSILVDSLS